MVSVIVISITGMAGICVMSAVLVTAGLRSGDVPGDATVTAVSEPANRVSERGRGGAWTEERGTSDEGRRRRKRPQASEPAEQSERAAGAAVPGLRSEGRATREGAAAGRPQASEQGKHSPVVIATVRNPADVPLMAGFTARRRLIPGWLEPGMSVTVPRRTTRRRYRASAQATVGVVPASGTGQFRVPVTAQARRYRLVAVLGQSGGRLRVHSVPVATRPAPGASGQSRPAPSPRWTATACPDPVPAP